MLQTLICQHDAVNPLIREAKYLRHLLNAYDFGKKSYAHETHYYFESEQAFDDFNEGIIRQFMQQTLKLFPEAEHLLLKEPHLTMMFPLLSRLIPEAKFICIVRNPLDVIASMIQVGKRLAASEINDNMSQLFNSGNMQALSQYYLSFYQPLLTSTDEHLKNSLCYIRYEDLVNQPKQVLTNLSAFVGFELSQLAETARVNTGKVSYAEANAYSSAWISPLYDKVPTKSRIGAYLEVLTKIQKKEIKQYCSSIMRLFHY